MLRCWAFGYGRRYIQQKLSKESVERNYPAAVKYGHLSAQLDPLNIEMPTEIINQEPFVNSEKFLNQPYGIEFGTVAPNERNWLINKINQMSDTFLNERREVMAKLMIESEAFDGFMQKRFGQVKRYGLEGMESLVVAVDRLIKNSDPESIVVFGMAHRGRLNLLIGPLGMDPRAIFAKLKGKSELKGGGSADVLSHLSINQIHEGRRLIMLPNPSHLEAINPVQQGFIHGLIIGKCILGVQIHGDGAVAGQGIVQESLQLSKIAGFDFGGTVHIITNNQLGFTADKSKARSGRYCTDVAHIINAPVFHVNGDHPEQVSSMIDLALEYRNEFKKDAFVEIVGYRKWGHNELDEPAFTQPQMYAKIRNRPLPGTLYARKHFSDEEIEHWRIKEFEALDSALQEFEKFVIPPPITYDYKIGSLKKQLNAQELKEIGIKSVTLPENFEVNARLAKYHIEHRNSILQEGKVDWATAEALAFGSLIGEGFKVRLVGQDCIRGTFSHRHAAFYDQSTNVPYFPLGPNYQVISSPLSELAVMGFEYGRSLSDVNTLHLWEAQFGDFFNGAQVMIDAFLSAGEQKWGVKSNLTLLLPHGYDGAGPEHSSCRLERFLQLCDSPMSKEQTVEECNLMVVNPTTPANYFHLLKSQIQRQKPLIVVAPKTLLRLPVAMSSLNDLANGSFKPVITSGEKKSRTLIVSGKFYYELVARLPQEYIVRIEQLNPLPLGKLKEALDGCEELIYVQEEPENMGAYSFLEQRIRKVLGRELQYIGRPPSAAPATGIPREHKMQLEHIFDALGHKNK